jgi:hypothetical protein
MRQDIKQEWINRLNSGITQTFNVLGRDDKRCAVGVLCDIAVEHGIASREIVAGAVIYDGEYAYSAPPTVLSWAGVPLDEARLIETLNDQRSSFKAIARYIDENL